MKIYAIAILAIRRKGGFSYSAAATKNAESKESAIGIGVELARRKWPQPDHFSHQCEIVEIPSKWFEEEQDE